MKLAVPVFLMVLILCPSSAPCPPRALLGSQDDPEELIRKLDDDSPDVREEAAQKLAKLGDRALPLLRKSKNAFAFQIVARIEWEPYVPLWVLAKDPTIAYQLASPSGKVAAAAYDEIIREGGLRWFLDRKIVRDGLPEVKRRVLAGFTDRWNDEGRVGLALELLAGWDTAREPLAGKDLELVAKLIAGYAKPGHVGLLRELASRTSDDLQAVGIIGLAALGDAEGRKAALVELRQGEAWRNVASAMAFERTPWPEAGPLLREQLARSDASVILEALEALEKYPEIDLHEPLVKLLAYKHRKYAERLRVQAAAMHLMAVRGIDESRRIWGLFEGGAFKRLEIEEVEPHAEFRTRVSLSWRLARSSLECRLGEAMLVPDDPKFLDLLEETEKSSAWTHQGMILVLHERVPPRIAARLEAIAQGREAASKFLRELANDFFEEKESNLGPEEALARLERESQPKNMRRLFGQLPKVRRLAPALRDKLVAMARKWIRDSNHPLSFDGAKLLHELGVKEGTDALLEMAKPETREAMQCLYLVYTDERARPILRERLKSQDEVIRYDALDMLSDFKGEIEPAKVIELLRNREFPRSTTLPGCLLKNYPDRDFTEELLKLLDDSTPPGHIVEILDYLRWRGRKDQLKRIRGYITDKNSDIRNMARRAVVTWSDKESYDTLAAEIDSERSDLGIGGRLRELAKIDPERTRSRILAFLREPVPERRSGAAWALEETARPQDSDLVMHLLRTQHGFGIARIAGRLECPGAAEALLLWNECGGWCARTGLAYLGGRRAVPALIEGLADTYDSESLSALDFIINRAHYPALAEKRHLVDEAGLVWLPITEARARLRKAFGLEFVISDLLDLKFISFRDDEDLIEFSEISLDGYCAHLWRNGRVELIPHEEARSYWKAWWVEHEKEFK